ncbi:hypothetical protein LIER_21010 [Lithospermum erythrorhizon]|uniref:Histone H2A n=1 Tax=Lithospermum erythrorhizon TaxID=34254 RepID=A0AAV3QRH7_LITER
MTPGGKSRKTSAKDGVPRATKGQGLRILISV